MHKSKYIVYYIIEWQNKSAIQETQSDVYDDTLVIWRATCPTCTMLQ